MPGTFTSGRRGNGKDAVPATIETAPVQSSIHNFFRPKTVPRACGALVRVLHKQDEYHVSLGDITDDSNLIAIGDDERDEDLRGHEESDTEEEEEEES